MAHLDTLHEAVQALGAVEALGNLFVPDLRNHCKNFELKSTGTKLDLIGRLGEYLLASGTQQPQPKEAPQGHKRAECSARTTSTRANSADAGRRKQRRNAPDVNFAGDQEIQKNKATEDELHTSRKRKQSEDSALEEKREKKRTNATQQMLPENTGENEERPPEDSWVHGFDDPMPNIRTCKSTIAVNVLPVNMTGRRQEETAASTPQKEADVGKVVHGALLEKYAFSRQAAHIEEQEDVSWEAPVITDKVELLAACHVGEREVLPQDTVDAEGPVEEKGTLGEAAQNSPDLDDVTDDASSHEESTANVIGHPQEETAPKSSMQEEEDVDKVVNVTLLEKSAVAMQAADCIEEQEDAFREAPLVTDKVELKGTCHLGEREILSQDTVNTAGTVEEKPNLGENAQNSPTFDVMDNAHSLEESTVSVVGQPQEGTAAKSAMQKEEDVHEVVNGTLLEKSTLAMQAADCIKEQVGGFREAPLVTDEVGLLVACHFGEQEDLPRDMGIAEVTVEERGNLGKNAQNSPDLDDVMDDASFLDKSKVHAVWQLQEDTSAKSTTQKAEEVDEIVNGTLFEKSAVAMQAADCIEEQEDVFSGGSFNYR